MIYTNEYLDQAHKHSIYHEKEIDASEICGCFCCCAMFPPSEITEWADEENPKGKTAICPKCDIDSVIASASGFPVTDPDFLNAMYEKWFS
jgi:hypothetical protein